MYQARRDLNQNNTKLLNVFENVHVSCDTALLIICVTYPQIVVKDLH